MDVDGEDEEENPVQTKKRKRTKAAEAKLKAKEKKKKGSDDDEDEDAYTALSKNSGGGFLCYRCAEAGGTDPFKKSAPKKRKAPADKRKITTFEEKRSPTLVSICIQVSRTTPRCLKAC